MQGSAPTEAATEIAPKREAAVMVSDSAGYEYYFESILDTFNMTIDDYTALTSSDKERFHKYVHAQWGFENGTLTQAEAEDMIRPNSPETYFGPVEALGYFDLANLFSEFTEKPSFINIPRHDDEGFEIKFVSRAPHAERITRVDVYLQTDAGSVHLYLAEESQPVDNGYVSGRSWVAYDWLDVLGEDHKGMCYHWPFLSDHCYFRAWEVPGCVDSSVDVVIRYEYDFFNLFHIIGYIFGIPIYFPAWETCTPYENHIDRYAIVNNPIAIQDDDTNAPSIGSIDIPESQGLPWETPWVYDTAEVMTITGNVYEGNLLMFQKSSGIGSVNVEIGEETFEYSADVEFVEVDTYGRYQYCYSVNLLNPGHWLGVGHHTATLTITDADNDRPGDGMTSSPMSIEFDIIDDDDQAPFVIVTIDSPIPSAGQAVLPFDIIAYDESGIGSVEILIGTYTINTLGHHEVLLPAGSYTLDVWVTDNDADGPNDCMTTERHLEGVIDITPPTTKTEVDGSSGETEWYVSDVSVTLAATDDISGVAGIMYSYDNKEWLNYVSPLTFEDDGIYDLYYFSVDQAGNKEEVKTLLLKIDKSPPMTSIGLDGVKGLSGWYTSDVAVTLLASDETSGVAKTEYSLDGSSWNIYSETFRVTYRGINRVYYRSIDLASNVENTKTIEIGIYVDSWIDIDPDVLNRDSNGNWLTVYIQLPEGFDAQDIDLSSLELRFGDSYVRAAWGKVQDGLLAVKFDRAALIDILADLETRTSVELQIWGQVAGLTFAGADVLKVL